MGSKCPKPTDGVLQRQPASLRPNRLTRNMTATFANVEPENKDDDTLSCNLNDNCGLNTNKRPSAVCQSQTVESGSQEAANILLGMSHGTSRASKLENLFCCI